MDLITYLNQDENTAADLARQIHVTPGCVSHWRTGIKSVPVSRCAAIERATKGQVSCEELRPDINWKYLRSSKG